MHAHEKNKPTASDENVREAVLAPLQANWPACELVHTTASVLGVQKRMSGPREHWYGL